MPRVTVMTPVHNGQRYLDQSIASVLRTGYDDLELIAIDDASTDETPQILEKWASQDPRVVVLRLETNRGPSAALNMALSIARGEYVARQDADDIAVAGRFSKQVAALDADPQAVFVAMERLWIDEQGRRRGRPRSIMERPDVIRFLLNFTPVVAGVPGQTMLRTADVRAIGGWNEAFRAAQGYEFITRLSSRGRFITIPDDGMLYRLHSDQLTRMRRDLQLHNAVLVTQRCLSALLEREVSFEEAAASGNVWFLHHVRGGATAAEQLFKEAFGRLHASTPDRNRIRHLAAAHFRRAAYRHVRRAEFPDAALHLASAIRLF